MSTLSDAKMPSLKDKILAQEETELAKKAKEAKSKKVKKPKLGRVGRGRKQKAKK
mgnify:CR=1 FL=1